VSTNLQKIFAVCFQQVNLLAIIMIRQARQAKFAVFSGGTNLASLAFHNFLNNFGVGCHVVVPFLCVVYCYSFSIANPHH
jgi:hypothetical protein